MSFTAAYLAEVALIAGSLDCAAIDQCVMLLAQTRANHGRVFVIGVGGSAANASHTVNDLRKLANIEAYAPTDNVAELSARTNDDGWHTVFAEWLKTSHMGSNDLLFVLSVSGGDVLRNVSMNIVSALALAHTNHTKIIGIVGRDDGYTARVATACVVIPIVHPDHITQHAESFQGIIWHLFVSHPLLRTKQFKWESVTHATVH